MKKSKKEIRQLHIQVDNMINNWTSTWVRKAQYIEHLKVGQFIDDFDSVIQPLTDEQKLNSLRQLHDLDFIHYSVQGINNKVKLKDAIWSRILTLERNFKPKKYSSNKKPDLVFNDVISEDILRKLSDFLKIENLIDENEKVINGSRIKLKFSAICHVLRVLKYIPDYKKTESTKLICKYYNLDIGGTSARQSHTGSREEKYFTSHIKNFFGKKLS